jgi:hypothetical protein
MMIPIKGKQQKTLTIFAVSIAWPILPIGLSIVALSALVKRRQGP